jgi:folate-binding protein YgfZ
MSLACNSVSLSLGVLRVHGADALTFLQGQVSNDVMRLTPSQALLAGYHNPQGRVIALLRLVQLAPADVLAILPRELAPAVAARLAKFILRAKVQVSDASAQWSVTGLLGGNAVTAAGEGWPQTPDGAARRGESIAVRLAGDTPRWLLVAPAAQLATPAGCVAAPREVWQRLSIAAGEPQVYARTAEEFVAQMLNLDALGAIDFDKGCYTGQEVIARAHYRGRVKRRMQRFVSTAPALLQPADAGVLGDGRPFKVVDAVALDDGRCEFLAVTPLAEDVTERAAASAAGAAGATPLGAQALSLPYRLPE